MNGKKQDVFLSHSAQDKDVAEKICAGLESRGLSCWMAPRDILPGESWSGAIIDAIEKSRCMVFIFSSNSNESPHVARELESAVSKRIPIIPFRIHDIKPSKSVEYFVTSAQWLDSSKNPSESDVGKLTDAVSRLIGRELEPVEDRVSGARAGRRVPVLKWVLIVMAVFVLLGVAKRKAGRSGRRPGEDTDGAGKPPVGQAEPETRIVPTAVPEQAEEAVLKPEERMKSATGTLIVRTVPIGAGVAVDGRHVGTSPVTVKGIGAVSHSLEITLAGHEALRTNVAVAVNGETGLDLALVPLSASLHVSTEPAGAVVLVDGKRAGEVTPCFVAVGAGRDFLITVIADGYVPVERVFHLGPGESGAVTIPLEREQGVLIARGSPSGAELWVDGERRGIIPASGARFNIALGKHSVEARKQSHMAMEPGEVVITAGRETVFEYALESKGGTVRVSPVLKDGSEASVELEVVLDGESLGVMTLPCDISDVKPGKHSIQVRGGKLSRPQEKAFRMSDSEDARVVIVFDLR